MKIGLIHNLYGELSRGGAETAVKIMADNFLASGNEVFIITTEPKNNHKKNSNTQSADKKSPPIYYLKSEFYNLNRHGLVYRAAWQIHNILSFKSAESVKGILEAEKPDLVITHNLMGPGFMIPKAIKKLNIRHEHFLHDIQLLHPSGLMIFGQEKAINRPWAKLYQALTRHFFASPDKVISPSEWLLEIHKQHGFFKDSEHEVRPFSWPGLKTNPQPKVFPAKNFLFIGQIEKQKGILLLIKAFRNIDNQDITLAIAIRGGGTSLAEAKKLATGDTRIRFLGPLSYEETEKAKADSDCLIMPSLCYENSPTVIYGAHAAGLPVIAARIGGIPELMKPSDLLFNPGDAHDLAKKIRQAAG